MTCWGVTPCRGVSMTMTSVVFGIAMLGTPEPPPDWDCARPAAGVGWGETRRGKHCCHKKRDHEFHLLILSISQSVYLAYSPTKSTVVLFVGKKILVFNEKLYEKIPRLHQHLVTLFRRQSHAHTRQHTGHAGD